MTDLPGYCLTTPTPVPVLDALPAWHARFQAGAAQAATPFEMALRGGFDADRLAWAFASGYQAATRALVPDLAPHELVTFSMTEPGGNRPRDLRTACRATPEGGYLLDGDKRWATLGPASTLYLVVCVLDTPAANGRAALRLARVPAGTPGLQAEAMPITRYMPELTHGALQLRGLRLGPGALLPGDGWEDHGKPFRTLEDTLVTTAVLAQLLREARARAWPGGFIERALAALLALQGVAALPPQAASTHVALAGALAAAQALFAEAGTQWAATPDDPAAQRWQRDAALLGVAEGTRVQRLARAWERLGRAAGAG